MEVLLTGGCGYIGSHTAVDLLEKGVKVIIVDDLSNSSTQVLNNIKIITGKDVTFYPINIKNKSLLYQVFKNHSIEAVIHFAAYKSVSESVKNPLKYYDNNITSLLVLLETMQEFNVNKFIFSSSATVYGNPTELPLKETSNICPINPYGRTKYFAEQILIDYFNSVNGFSLCILRYFNPVAAHSSGLIGENPKGTPNNLFPYIFDVIRGKRDSLKVFGDDYPTRDGTGIRDYIHIMDLACGHSLALNYLIKSMDKTIKFYNLGTGRGYTVLEIINCFNKHLDKPIKYNIVERRDGDSAAVYADYNLINKELGWKPVRDLDDMIKDSLNFIKF